MVKDERIYYFVGNDNIAVLKGLHNNNIFKGNYKMNFFGERTISFDETLLSNEKSLLNNNEKTPLKAHVVYYDVLNNKPFFENLNISLHSEIAKLKMINEKLQRENNHLQKLVFNIKGTDKFNENMLNFLDTAGKARAKIYQYSEGSGFGGGFGLEGGLLSRYNPISRPIGNEGETQF